MLTPTHNLQRSLNQLKMINSNERHLFDTGSVSANCHAVCCTPIPKAQAPLRVDLHPPPSPRLA
jgi:hypothetical protein